MGRGLGFNAHVDRLANRLRRDPVFLIVGRLDLPPPKGLVDRPLHRIGDLVGIEHDLCVDVSRGPADRLHQRGLATQEAFLIGVEDGDHRHLGQVQSFSQQVHAHQNVKMSLTQISQQLDPFKSVQLAMEPLAPDILLDEVSCQVFGQSLGECCDEHSLADRRSLANLFEQMRHLRACGRHFDFRIEQSGGPYHLFDHFTAGLFEFVRPGRCRNEDDLPDALFPFLEAKRPVVQGAGQSEPVFDERYLAVVVAKIHSADLRNADVRFIDDQQIVLGKEAEERIGRRSGRPATQRAAVVLDARAVAHFLHHLDVESRAGAEPMGFEQFSLGFELGEPFVEFAFDLVDGRADSLIGQNEMFAWIDEQLVAAFEHFAADGMDDRKLFDLVAPKLDAESHFFVAWPDFDAIAPHAELARLKLDVASLVLDVDQLAEHMVAIDNLAKLQPDHHGAIILRRAKAVDARHAGDDDHIAATDQRTGGRQPQAVDLLVDGRVFFDVDIPLRNVRLGLIVVVIADEVVDAVMRKNSLNSE